jgi:mRNA-degrading endonuclease toxin of MazEF toxin-antitoxin module
VVLPQPIPGLVIRYSYLWRRENQANQPEGRKDRPCAIILSATVDRAGRCVYVLPITHAAPRDPKTAIEIPKRVRQHLGLDTERCWVVLDELNRFSWPGFDLRPVPGSDPPRVHYGVLPGRFFDSIRKAFLDLYRQRRVKGVSRT